MKQTFLTALVVLFCVTSQAQVNPKMQALFEQLKELDEPPQITKTGGAGNLVRLNYSVNLYYSPEMFSGVDSLELDSLLQDERWKLKRQVAAIRHTLDQLQEEAQESYHYEYHQGGNDTIIYSMNLCQDTTRVLKYQSDNHTMFHSDERLWFSYQPYLPKKGFTGNLSYQARVPDASLETVPYTLSILTADIDHLFKQHRIKPRKAIWRHDKAYSDSVSTALTEYLSKPDSLRDDLHFTTDWGITLGIGNVTFDNDDNSPVGVTDATIYTVPLSHESLAKQLLATIDSLAQHYTNSPQDHWFQYNYGLSFEDHTHLILLSLEATKREDCYILDIERDDFGYHFLVAQTQGLLWVPFYWPSLKSFINGKKTYFKGMEPKS